MMDAAGRSTTVSLNRDLWAVLAWAGRLVRQTQAAAFLLAPHEARSAVPGSGPRLGSNITKICSCPLELLLGRFPGD